MDSFLHYKLNCFFLLCSFLLYSITYGQQNRAFDGVGNNLQHPEWGAVGTNQLQIVSNGFSDGISKPGGSNRDNPRNISNAIFTQEASIPDALKLSDFAWVWGQFIDHDITLSPDDPNQPMNISVPSGDEYFDPQGTGAVIIPMNRSAFDPSSGTDLSNPRAFPTGITAFIDASAVYGSSVARSQWLRTFQGGKLKTSSDNFLPYNTLNGEFSDAIDPSAPEMAMPFPQLSKWFVAGDIRANENPLLTSLHTLFVRDHNRQCDQLIIEHPDWSDEQIYQHVRKIIGGIMAAIVFEEWLPSLGVVLEEYTGYNELINPGIMNVFSTAAYRYGHTVINSSIVRMNNKGDIMPDGNLLLRDAFFNPGIIGDGGIDPLLKGMASQIEQEFDCRMIDDLRNFLLGPPGAGGLDLAALNINRGRDRGLPDYNTVRSDLGLARMESFEDISADPKESQNLNAVFGNIDNVDPWVGFLAENHMPDALFGETVMFIMKRQFTGLRDGDRYYYEIDEALSALEKNDIKNTRLVDMIVRNSGARGFQKNVFFTSEDQLIAENRSYDGTNNNLQHSEWGAAGTDQLSVVSNGFSDGISAPGGDDRPNPRTISNEIFNQEVSVPDPLKLSDFAWVWGQFIDHDITLSPDDPKYPMNIAVPTGDPHFDPAGTGTVEIRMNRSAFNPSGGTCSDDRRTFPSGITAFIDGSAVYGSDEERANWLRTFVGGKLKMSLGNLLPYNTISGEFEAATDPDAPEMAMANPSLEMWYVAGDIRANENPMLTSIHTLFAREHNRQCDILANDYPGWSDERIYQHARKIVGGKIEAIVYEEWLPTLGVEFASYTGYDPSINPGIRNVFSTAAYRYGHTVINSLVTRLNNDGSEFSEGNILLRDAFFNPLLIIDSKGIDPFLKGMSSQVEQDLDSKMVDELRNFLFGPPGAGGLDLAALNINRGRDRGLPDYNTIRRDIGLSALESFSSISSDTTQNDLLEQLYGDINNIDAWVGFLAEEHMPNTLYSESILTIVKRQFIALRDGDRFYYEVDPQLSDLEKNEIKNTRLVDIIRANSGTENLQENVFLIDRPLFAENRTFDGFDNNLNSPEWGAVGTSQLQLVSNGFSDGISEPGGQNRPNPRLISNEIFAQDGLLPDELQLSDYAWVWGQFIDHDITLSPDNSGISMNISVPSGDEYFDPNGTGAVVIPMNRSAFDPASGTDLSNPRAFPTGITAFIDASAVYGSSIARANWLRTFERGKLKMSSGDLLPYNTISGEYSDTVDINAPEMAMANPTFSKWFVAGDIRANENPLLTSLHTIFAREHNRICEILFSQNPSWTDEDIYQHTRKLVGGYMEAIVYEEWLPTMGVEVSSYEGYSEYANPGIMNIFSSAAYRYGHTVINSSIIRMDNDGSIIPQGNMVLKDAFFNPEVVGFDGGVDPLLKGMATQMEQAFDCKMIDDLRNFLFGPPGAGGLDLAAININRGRDRGLPDYNTVRTDIGLAPVESFTQLTKDPFLNQVIESVYNDVNDLDPWVGFLSEDHMPNSLFGESVKTIMEEQFAALRDGDRFYYQVDPALSPEEKDDIVNTRLVDIILRNTNVTGLQQNVFITDPLPPENVDTVSITGEIVTAFGHMVEGVAVTLNDGSEDLTSTNGQYTFYMPSNNDYRIRAFKDNDYLNGVSTLDAVLIQKHILGLYNLNSPYKVISADINSDEKVSALDLTELRKLILGIYSALPSNDSWRFVDAYQSFDEPDSPFPINEELEVKLGSEDIYGMNFIATKIGDVSGNAIANSQVISEARNLRIVSLLIDDVSVDAGSLVSVAISAKDFNDITAFQFTMDIAGLEFVGVKSGAVEITDTNFGVLDRNTITAAWYNTYGESTEDALFTMIFRATKNLTLSEAIGLSSRVTKSEAYSTNEERFGLELEFIPARSSSFTLYQNEPNPFNDATTISFNLPEAGKANLNIFDVTGKSVFVRTGDFTRGLNQIHLNRAELGATGVMYYQLVSGEFKATRKMILMD